MATGIQRLREAQGRKITDLTPAVLPSQREEEEEEKKEKLTGMARLQAAQAQSGTNLSTASQSASPEGETEGKKLSGMARLQAAKAQRGTDLSTAARSPSTEGEAEGKTKTRTARELEGELDTLGKQISSLGAKNSLMAAPLNKAKSTLDKLAGDMDGMTRKLQQLEAISNNTALPAAERLKAAQSFEALLPYYRQGGEKYTRAASGYNAILPTVKTGETRYQDLVARYQSALDEYDYARSRGNTRAQELEKAADDLIAQARALESTADEYNAMRPTQIKPGVTDWTPEQIGAWQQQGFDARQQAGELTEQARAKLKEADEERERYSAWKYQQDMREYADLPGAADFAEKSQADLEMMTPTGKATYLPIMDESGSLQIGTSVAGTGYKDTTYAIINGDKDAFNIQSTDDQNTGDDHSYLLQIDDDQRAMYNYLYSTRGKKAADTYLEKIKPQLLAKQREIDQKYWQGYAREHWGGASALSILTNPLKAISYLGQVGDVIAGRELDPNATYNKFVHIPNDIRSQVSADFQEKHGDIGSNGYQIAMSMADFMYNAFLTGDLLGGEAAAKFGLKSIAKGMTKPAIMLMMAERAADAVVENKERGLDDTRAFIMGTASGLIEGITESISLETLLDATGMADHLLGYLIKNRLAEGSEEISSDILNWSLDALYDLISGESNSEYKQQIREKVKNGNNGKGMSSRDAAKAVIQERFSQTAWDFIGGWVSGGIMSSAGVGVNAIQARAQTNAELAAIGKDYRAAWQDLIREGLQLPQGSEARVYAEQLMDKLARGQQVTDADLGRLVAANEQTIREDLSTAAPLSSAEEEAETTLPSAAQTVPSEREQTTTEMERYQRGKAEAQAMLPQIPGQTEKTGNTLPAAEGATFPQGKAEGETKLSGMARLQAAMEQTETERPSAADTLPQGEKETNLRTEENNGQRINAADIGGPGAELFAGDRGRGPGERTGQQGTRLGAQPKDWRTLSQPQKAAERQNRGRSLRTEKVSPQDLGIRYGSDEKTVTVYPESAWDDELKAINAASLKETGRPVTFVLGPIPIPGTASGKVRGVNAGGRIIIQADNLNVSAVQLFAHEMFHTWARSNPGLVEQVKQKIIEKYSREEFEAIVDRYLEKKAGAMDLSKLDEESLRKLTDKCTEEVCADAYAGINAFGAQAGKYTPESRQAVQEVRQGNRENSAATARTTGPPEDYTEAYSVESIFHAAGFNVSLQGGRVIATDQNGQRITEMTEDMVSRSGIGAMVRYAQNVTKSITAKEAQTQIEGLTRLFNLMLKAQDGDMVWRFAGSAMFSAVKSNSDGQYSTTVDFSTVCKKTQEMMETMSRVMMKTHRGLTKAQIIELQNDILEENGLVPCPVCYVFSRWAGVGGILDNMAKYQRKYDGAEWDDQERVKARIAQLKDATKSKKSLRELLKAEDNSYLQYTGELEANKAEQKTLKAERKRLTGKKADQAANAARVAEIDKRLKELTGMAKMLDADIKGIESSGAPEAAWLERVRISPDYREQGYVEEDLLYNLLAADELAERKPLAWGYRTTRGPSAGKAILPYSDMRLGDWILGPGKNSAGGKNMLFSSVDEEFSNDQTKKIEEAKKKVLAQNLIGGQRYQSTSDFMYDYGLDYLLSFFEGQMLGSKMQTYTKVMEFVNLVASVHGDVNISMMPLDAGYVTEADGRMHLIYSSVTGANPEAAIRANHLFDNAQLILVGINDEHILLALEDSEETGGIEIGFVIPYHASGASINTFIRGLVENLKETFNEENYKNYEPIQNDSHRKGATKTQQARERLRHYLLTGKRSSEENYLPTGNENGLTDEEMKLLKGKSKDISGRSFEELRAIEKAALAGDKAAIKEYESWSAGFLGDLYRKMWTNQRARDTYGVRLSGAQSEHIMPHEYWDTGVDRAQAYINGFRFRSYCYSLGLTPRFTGVDSTGKNIGYGDFSDARGYWKTLIDRPMYDNQGHYRDQQTINVTELSASIDGAYEEGMVGSGAGMLSPAYGRAFWGENAQTPDTGVAARAAQRYLERMNSDEMYSEEDEEYLAAVEAGDMETAQRMVDEAAKRAGYVTALYHGTGEYFNVFRRGSEAIHLGNEAIAREVAHRRYRDRSQRTFYHWSDIQNRVAEMDTATRQNLVDRMYDYYDTPEFAGDINDANAVREYVDKVLEDYKKSADKPDYDMPVTLPTFDRKIGENVMRLYARISNPFTVNGDLGEWSTGNIAGMLLRRAAGADEMELPWSGKYIRIGGSEFSPSEKTIQRLRDLAEFKVKGDDAWVELSSILEETGYDGIKYLNQYEGDKNSYSYIALNPSDVKSADPVTYDDQGNVIPLSERFNPEEEDIRFSEEDEYTAEDLPALREELKEISDPAHRARLRDLDRERFNANEERRKELRRTITRLGTVDPNLHAAQADLERRQSLEYQQQLLAQGGMKALRENEKKIKDLQKKIGKLERLAGKDLSTAARSTSPKGEAETGGPSSVAEGDTFPQGKAETEIPQSAAEYARMKEEGTLPEAKQTRDTRHPELPAVQRRTDNQSIPQSAAEYARRKAEGTLPKTFSEETRERISEIQKNLKERDTQQHKDQVYREQGAEALAAEVNAIKRLRNELNRLEQGDRPKPAPTKNQAYLAKRELGNTLLGLFSVPNYARSEARAIIEHYAEIYRKTGELHPVERMEMFRKLWDLGEIVYQGDEDRREIYRWMRNSGKIRVNAGVKADFGDDWNDFRKRAFKLGIFFTENQADRGWDSLNQELAEAYPGLFDADETDPRTVLERIVQLAEEGQGERMTLAEYAAQVAGEDYADEDEMRSNMYRQLDNALRVYASSANIETYLRNKAGETLAKERDAAQQRLEKAVQRERARGERLVREAEEKGQARIEAVRKREALERGREKEARRAAEQRKKELAVLRETQQKTLQQLQWLSRNQNKFPEEAKKRVQDILADIDIYAISAADEMHIDNATGKTWKELADIYKAAKEKDPNWLPSKDMERIVARLDNAKIGHMDIDALRTLYQAAVQLRTELYNRNNLINDMMHREFEEVFSAVRKELEAAPQPKDTLAQRYADMQLTPMNRFLQMAGWDKQSQWYQMAQMLEQGERDERRFKTRAQNMVGQFLRENQDWARRADGQGKDAIWYEIEVPELLELGMGDKPIFGKTVKVWMTPAQKVELYLESKGYDNLRHMTGGRTFPDRELYSKGERKAAFEKGKTIRLAPESVKNIVKDLTPEEMALANLLEQFYNGFSKTEINRVSNLLYGYDKAMEAYYAPIYTNDNYTKSEPGVFDLTAEGVGNLKERQVSSTPSLNLSAFDALERSIDKTAKFVGMAIPIRNMNTLWNWYGEGTTLKEIVSQKWPVVGKNFVEDLMTELQNGRNPQNGKLDELVNKALNKYISSVFGFNPSVVLKQFASYPLAGAYLGWENMPKWVPGAADVDTELISAYTGELDYRMLGYATPETAALKNNPGVLQRRGPLNFLLGGGAITWMDGFTVRTLWTWAENKVSREQPELERGTDEQIRAGQSEYYQAVAKEFEEAVSRSQPMYDTMHRSDVMRKQGAMTRAFTLFKTVPQQEFNMLRESYGEVQAALRSGDEEQIRTAKGKMGRTVTGIAVGNLMIGVISFLNALLKNKGKKYRDDDGEMNLGSVMEQFGKQYFHDTLGLTLGGDLAADQVAALLWDDKLYDIESPGLEQVNELYQGIQNATKSAMDFVTKSVSILAQGGNWAKYMADHGDEYITAVTETATLLGTYGAGLPVENVKGYLLGALRWMSPKITTAYEDLMSKANRSGLKGLTGGALELRMEHILRDQIGNAEEETVYALSRLFEAGITDAAPPDTPAKVTVNLEDRKLNAMQEQQYSMAFQRTVGSNLDTLIRSNAFRNADAATRGKMVKIVYDYAREEAKAAVWADYSPDNAKAKSFIDAGGTLAQWAAFKAGTTGKKKDYILEYIDGMDLTYDQKDSLYYAAGYAESTVDDAPWHRGGRRSRGTTWAKADLSGLMLPAMPQANQSGPTLPSM